VTAYYNEIDPYAAQWLRNLIAAGHIAPGDVDERSIVDISPDDLRGYNQCHFFAGIGGWSHALRLAGWPDDRPVWTGSCPCQPFSAAGKGQAADDERHLWPAWFSLIRECRSPVVFGEQVEAAIGWGWLDAVFADLEAEGYACGAAVLPACGVGAPHIRQRLWFVGQRGASPRQRAEKSAASSIPMADAGYDERTAWSARREQQSAASIGQRAGSDSEDRGLADAGFAGGGRNARAIPGTQGTSEGERGGAWDIAHEPVADGAARELADATGGGTRAIQQPGQLRGSQPGGEIGELADADGQQCEGAAEGARPARRRLPPGGRFWNDLQWLPCTDGKARPIEPGTFPLAHGIPGRVGRLRAYGNAIVPQVAAEFIRASQES
jgi:DNA (cytosine-5)-methyltransferase 1